MIVGGFRPVVSCIMATHNRRSFLKMAVECFSRQTYFDAELIVVDDGEADSKDLCLGCERVTYVRLHHRTNLGQKLNIGIQQARGDLIQKLDDDDYYAPQFLETAVAPFLYGEANPERSLVAWDCFALLLRGRPPLRFSGHGWCAGGTFCFSRHLCAHGPFRDVPRNVDWFFLRDHSPEIIATCAPDLYMLVRHGRNTWSIQNSGESVDESIEKRPTNIRGLGDIVNADQYAFYESLLLGSAELDW